MPTLFAPHTHHSIAAANARRLGPFAAIDLAEQRAAYYQAEADKATTSLERAAYAVEARRWREAGAALLARSACA